MREQHKRRAWDGSLERHEMSSVRPAEGGRLETVTGLDFILRVMGITGKLQGQEQKSSQHATLDGQVYNDGILLPRPVLYPRASQSAWHGASTQ